LDPTSPEVQAELTRRHKAASITVIGLIVATVLLCIIAFLSRHYLQEQSNPPLEFGMRIAILVLGVGAVGWRRVKLAPMRLQDIYGLAGPSGLLKTLEKTSIQLALFGVAIIAIGFFSTLSMGSDAYTYWSALIALIIFGYFYPRKSVWQRVLSWFSNPERTEVAEGEKV
jgi:hypothetical protein